MKALIEEIKDTYEKILELNIEINSLLNDFPSGDFEEFNEKLQNYIEIKGENIQKLLSLKENHADAFSEVKQDFLKEISERIDVLEKENLELICEKKVFLSEEIGKTNVAAKALSAYKFNRHDTPRIFDETD